MTATLQPPTGNWKPVVALLLSAGWLAGCSVGPDYKAPTLALPGKWSGQPGKGTTAAPQLARWWTRFDDPILDRLMDEAVAGNLDVAMAKANIRQARATRRQAIGSLFPSLEGTGEALGAKSGSTTLTGYYPSEGQFQAGFDASWELDLFGENRRTVEAATYGEQAAEENLRSTLLTLVGDVAADYVEARGYQARIALAQRTAASERQTAALTRTKFQVGSSSAVDVSNAEGEAASTEATIPQLRASYATTVHSLAVLTGRAPAELDALMKKPRRIPSPGLPMPTGIPASILNNRPDVRYAERQLAQYTAKIGEAEAARYPSVSLTGDITTSGTKVGDLGKGSSISWSFGPTLTVPIFNGGQLAAAVDVARAERDQYFVAYKSAVLTALKDVEDAIVSLTQERIRYGKLAASAKSYGEAFNLGQSLYKAGSQSFLDLLTAQRSFYSAEDSQIQSQVSMATDYIALNKALGGGWTGTVDVSKPEVVDVGTGPHRPAAP